MVRSIYLAFLIIFFVEVLFIILTVIKERKKDSEVIHDFKDYIKTIVFILGFATLFYFITVKTNLIAIRVICTILLILLSFANLTLLIILVDDFKYDN